MTLSTEVDSFNKSENLFYFPIEKHCFAWMTSLSNLKHVPCRNVRL